MLRAERISDFDWTCRAMVRMEDTLDALEWCRDHQGRGHFHFTWALLGPVTGLFQFQDPEDHMMFTMLWVR